MTKSCEAKTIGQEHACTRCGFIWDINDPDPPQCKTKGELQAEQNRRTMSDIRKIARKHRFVSRHMMIS